MLARSALQESIEEKDNIMGLMRKTLTFLIRNLLKMMGHFQRWGSGGSLEKGDMTQLGLSQQGRPVAGDQELWTRPALTLDPDP